jgi:hypothetical protein
MSDFGMSMMQGVNATSARVEAKKKKDAEKIRQMQIASSAKASSAAAQGMSYDPSADNAAIAAKNAEFAKQNEKQFGIFGSPMTPEKKPKYEGTAEQRAQQLNQTLAGNVGAGIQELDPNTIGLMKKQAEQGMATPEYNAYLQQLKERSEGKNLAAEAATALEQEKAQKRAMAMAYARGYDPGASRSAARQLSEQQTELSVQGMKAAADEKTQALGMYGQAQAQQAQFQQQAMQAYNQILQYQQQFAAQREDAKKAYLMGNAQLAQQYEISLRQIDAGIKGAQSQFNAAQSAADAQQRAAMVGGVATLGAAAMTVYGGPAAGAATGAAINTAGNAATR